MKGEKLQDAIGMIDDELVVDAEYVAPKKMANLWLKYGSCAAAVLVLLVAVVVGTAMGFCVSVIANYLLSVLFVYEEKGKSKTATGMILFVVLK